MTILEVDHSHTLYPMAPKLQEGFLKVSDIHELYYATYGNPQGIPVILLHGGPGAGFNESTVKVFNPEKYYIIGFDQRGTLRSKPFASLEENTAHHLRDDIEKIRLHLQIDKWLVFGGSWGSALAILYGQTYPDHCLGFILRGVSLLRKDDIRHILYDMGKIFPEAYAPVIDLIPVHERSDLFAAYYKRVMNPDTTLALEAARTVFKFDIICGTHLPEHEKVDKLLQNEKLVLGMAKLFLHYSINNFFSLKTISFPICPPSPISPAPSSMAGGMPSVSPTSPMSSTKHGLGATYGSSQRAATPGTTPPLPSLWPQPLISSLTELLQFEIMQKS